MQNLGWKILLILVVLGACVLALSMRPLRLGRDLRGGVSLTYSVTIPPDARAEDVLAQVIQVLKDRVNPQGVFDITFVPQGRDRIEIIMPLPSPEVQQLRDDYAAAMDRLVAEARISTVDLLDSLRANQAVARFGGTGESAEQQRRRDLVTRLQDAYNALQTKRQELQAKVDAGTPEDQLGDSQQQVADAQIAYEELLAQVGQLSLDRAAIERALRLPATPEVQRDASNDPVVDPVSGEPVMQKSPRELEIQSLKNRYPHLAASIDDVAQRYGNYASQRKGLDDPEDLIRLLQGAGVLEYHIAVRNSRPEGVNIEQMAQDLQERGPENVDSTVAGWYPINDLKQWYETPEQLTQLQNDPAMFFSARDLVAREYKYQYYLLLYNTDAKSLVHDRETSWAVVGTGRTVDQLGRPAVSFRLDQAGGGLMRRMTSRHINEPMAIVLDGEIYTAPSINDAIGTDGIIVGRFSEAELTYLTRVLAAGSLEARLSPQPIAITTLGPSIGQDNLLRGLKACWLSIVLTALFMLIYYFFAGVVADIALLCNALMIFGLMSMIDGTFTLPGLAGIALSVAMAVDANVLIYERIREELVNNKEDLRTAIRLGYQRALSAIIDGNITNLIVCAVLYQTATTEVKGFALTLALGVAATLFSALFITRVIFTIYTEVLKSDKLPMLATTFPAIHRALEPSIDWISKRWVFFTASAIAVVVCTALAWSRGESLLETEFRGGVSLTMKTRAAHEGEPASPESGRLLLSRGDVEQRIRAIGEAAGPGEPVVHELRNASILTVGRITGEFQSDSFQIKTATPSDIDDERNVQDRIVSAIVGEFRDQIDASPPLQFSGTSGEAIDPDHTAHTFRVDREELGRKLDKADFSELTAPYRGGVGVVVENISPPVTIDSATQRIQRLRNQPDFVYASSWDYQVVGITPADPTRPEAGFSSIAVLVYEPTLSLQNVEFAQWDRDLAARAWRLVATSLHRGSSFEQISSFSPAVADTLAANAVVATVLSLLGILVYIWVRFGSLRYSLGATIALAHDIFICVGVLALTGLLAKTALGSWLLLDDFRIDLNVIAALLTITGYSVNDTIVIFDRIRENRGKLPLATADIINKSINQTFSRTILTGGTTLVALIVLYILGGTGIRPFAFTFLIGLLTGTYSSVAIAAPFVLSRGGESGGRAEAHLAARRDSSPSLASAS
jgi:SecD/SecF fusion protein